MASGSYAKKTSQQAPLERSSQVPARATRDLRLTDPRPTRDLHLDQEKLTRQLQATEIAEYEREAKKNSIIPKGMAYSKPQPDTLRPTHKNTSLARQPRTFDTVVLDTHPLKPHVSWLKTLGMSVGAVVLILLVVLSAGIYQRNDTVRLLNTGGGQVYDMQVGGADVKKWDNAQTQNPTTNKITPVATGSSTLLGKPTITADHINKVLAAYNSPAQGKGQALYDLGIKYGIDPAYSLAFFMHESTFGTKGVARESKSLGNIRCVPSKRCGPGNYTYYNSWEEGFEHWHQLILNLYILEWKRDTVDKIIPKYAPSTDNNNEQAYINSVKHAVGVWRAGGIRV